MYQIDFKKPMHIHFIGIGGISMQGSNKSLCYKNNRRKKKWRKKSFRWTRKYL